MQADIQERDWTCRAAPTQGENPRMISGEMREPEDSMQIEFFSDLD